MAPKRVNRAAAAIAASEPPPAVSPDTRIIEAPKQMRKSSTKLLRLPGVIILSFIVTASFHALSERIWGPELAFVAKRTDRTWTILTLVAYRAAELSVLWYTDFEPLDATLVALLIRTPHFFLLSTFYLIPQTYIRLAVFTTIPSIYLPWKLFQAKGAGVAIRMPDLTTILATSFLGAALYALPLLASYYTGLPTFLIIHFDGLRTLDPTHTSTIFSSALFTIPLGFMAAGFLLVPALFEKKNVVVVEEIVFDPATATLYDTILYNFRYTQPAKILLSRTAILAVLTFLHTAVQTRFELSGVDTPGALGWATVWTLSATLTGVVYGWVAGFW